MSGSPLRTALGFAIAYSILVVLGSVFTGGRSLERLHRPLYQVVTFYFVAAIVIGLLAGLAARWVTNRLKAGLAGFLIGLPVALTIYLVFRPEFTLEVMLIASLLSAGILGVGYGVILWDPPESDEN